ncbi:NRAMP family divalent metal transporter [Acuticoccus sp.]|uniref:NRAMP family divalent metal transporter n=1 Tax=Acuticoccus sp. TaxID=1904378 RepID=UPI003B5196E9
MSELTTAQVPTGAATVVRFGRAFGPGIMLAGAAIGGSHLVSSTQAGAIFGWGLLPVLLAVNLAKYPFFRAAVQYTSATDETVLHGYARLGRAHVGVFFLITLLTSILNIAGVIMITASLALLVGLPETVSLASSAIVTTWLCAGLVLANRFSLLSGIIQIVIVVLFAATFVALGLAAMHFAEAPDAQRVSQAVDLASIGFIIQFMGWMPAPIDVAAWPSIWARQQATECGYSMTWRSRSLDFHVGYIVTVILAMMFLALGKLVYGGTNEPVAMIGGAFARDLVDLYAGAIGTWAVPLIAGAAFLTMFSTALTCFDAWPRSLALSLSLLLGAPQQDGLLRLVFLLGLALACLLTIGFWSDNVGELLFLAMVVSFTTSPILAWFNLRVMQLANVPPGMRFGPALVALSWFGLVFLVLGSVAFIIWLVAT